LDPKTTYLEAEEKILSGSTRLCPILSKRSFTSEALTKRIRLTIGLSVLFLGSLSAHGFCAQASSAAKKRLDAELLRLELGTRIEQRCNKHAMDTVRREHRPMDPDEALSQRLASRKKTEAVCMQTELRFEAAAIGIISDSIASRPPTDSTSKRSVISSGRPCHEPSGGSTISLRHNGRLSSAG
jgi:hypothetical protein